MNPMSHAGGGQMFGPIIIVVIVVAVMIMRNRRPRPLRIERLWIRPLIYMAIVSATVAAAPPPLTALSLLSMAVALALGAALGWQRGRFMHIEVHPETHALTTRASPIGLVFIMAVLALRIGLRSAAFESGSAFGFPAAVITDALIFLLGAMITASSLEMWLRARRLLAEAEAAKTGAAGLQPRRIQEPIVR